jgi:hypothetical protein
MPDLYTDTYHDLYGTLGVVPGGLYSLDGVNAPQVIVEVAFGGTTTVDPAGGYFVLDASVLGTGQLGTIGFVDVTADVVRVSTQRGQAGEIEQAAPGTCQIILDNTAGTYDPLNAAGPWFGQLDVGVPVWVKAIWQGVTYPLFRGYTDSIDVDAGFDPQVTLACTDGLEVLGRVVLRTGFPYPDGETTGQRIGRILDGAAWPTSLRRLDVGLSTCQQTNLADAGSALAMLNDAVATELGLLAVDASGVVQFYDRLHVYTNARSQTVRATISDVGTDIDMLEVTVSKRRDLVFNRALITRNGGVEQQTDDAASQVLYGVRTFSGQAGTLLRTDADAYSIGNWILGRSRTPQVRVTHVRIHAQTQGMWTTLLPLTFLDRIRVIRDYGPAPIDVQVLIQALSHDITQDYWEIGFDTRNVDGFKPFVLNTSKLNTGTLA